MAMSLFNDLLSLYVLNLSSEKIQSVQDVVFSQ